MASKKIRPTPPPGGPAMVMRPALGALLFGLSSMACGDDGSGGDTGQPPMPDTEGPMPNPTTSDQNTTVPPMIPPTTSTGESADTGTSTDDGGTELPPMPGPDTTTTDDGGSSSGSGSDSGSTGPIPPMPPPMPLPDPGDGG